MMTIEELIDDVLLLILRKLSLVDRIRVERVCRRWQRLARSSWKNMHALSFCKYFEDDHEFVDVRDCNRVFIAFLRRLGPFLQSLDLTASFCASVHVDLSIKSFRAIGKHSPQLTSLDLSYQPICNQKLGLLANAVSQLESLTMVRCFEDEQNPDQGLILVFGAMRQLKFVDLSVNDNVIGDCFSALNCPLETLVINRCFSLNIATLAAVAARTKIKNFEFSSCSSDLSALLVFLKHLETLKLSYYEGGSLSQTLCNLNNLRSLDLSHSPAVDSHLIQSISEHCQDMETLNISGKSGARAGVSLGALDGLQRLRQIDISWMEQLTDMDMFCVAKHSQLEVVHAHMCTGITSSGFLLTVRLNPQLHLLDVTGCAAVGINFLEQASRLVACQGRRKPLLVQVDAIRDDAKVRSLNHSNFQVLIFT